MPLKMREGRQMKIKLEDEIDDADDRIEDARDEIEDADDDGEDVD